MFVHACVCTREVVVCVCVCVCVCKHFTSVNRPHMFCIFQYRFMPEGIAPVKLRKLRT